MRFVLTTIQNNLAVILISVAVVGLSFFSPNIPYVSLVASLFSTLLLLFLILLFKSLGSSTKKKSTFLLIALLIASYIFEALGFSFFSEVIGNCFYIFLIYETIVLLVHEI